MTTHDAAAPGQVRIRPAEQGDIGSLTTIAGSSAEHHVSLDPPRYLVPDEQQLVSHFAEVLTGADDCEILVAEMPEKVCGYVELQRSRPPSASSMLRPIETARAEIAVSPSHRGRGIGAMLIIAARQWAADQGVARLVVDVHAANRDALALYERLGFSLFGVLLELPVNDEGGGSH